MRGSRLRFALTMIAFVVAIVGAILAGGIGLDRLCPPTWTLAFYLDGSDSLLSEQQKNLREIVAGRAGFPDSRVLVCLDRGRSPRIPIQHGWEGPRIFEIDGSYREILARPLADTDDLFSGNRSKRMAAFFSWVKERYPSRYTAFFIVGHGQGWNPGSPVEGREAGFNAPDIARALSFSGPDILCLDLCLMGDLESVYQLRHSADYLVVSQGMLPSRAQDYRILFKRLGETPPRTLRQMADQIHAASSGALRESRLSGAVTLIRTGPSLEAFVLGLGEKLERENIRTALTALDPEAFRLPDWGQTAHQMIDLGGIMAAVPALKNENLGTDAFVLNVFSTHSRFSGLSVYWPTDEAHHAPLRDAYRSLDFTTTTQHRWLDLIESRLANTQSLKRHSGTSPSG